MSQSAERTARHQDTTRVRAVYQRQASHYDRIIAVAERPLFPGGREWAGRRVRDSVLEVAIGTGRYLPHYPADVELTGIDLSPAMLARARGSAERLGLKIRLREGDAQRLPLPGATCDTVVVTLTLSKRSIVTRLVASKP